MTIPKKGEYNYHYKHSTTKDILNYAYIIEGIALHSEDESLLVAYRPLYSGNHVEEFDADFNVKPLEMFCESIDKAEYSGPRFRKMTDQEVARIIEVMY